MTQSIPLINDMATQRQVEELTRQLQQVQKEKADIERRFRSLQRDVFFHSVIDGTERCTVNPDDFDQN